MTTIHINTRDDPRTEPYRNLKLKNLQRGGEFFIAEGKKVVERLLDSEFQTASVFICEKHLDEWQHKVPTHVPLYVAPQELMNDLVGFDFHVGVVGCGVRRKAVTLEQTIPISTPNLSLLVCTACDNPENLGGIIRLGAAFGMDALILGKACCDPYSRRVIRVSMGSAFTLPIFESSDLSRDLLRLKTEWQIELVATVLSDDAESLETAKRPARMGILMGNEDSGLDQSTIQLCDRKVTIPMSRGTDSLNVAVAAGIIMYHFTSEKSKSAV